MNHLVELCVFKRKQLILTLLCIWGFMGPAFTADADDPTRLTFIIYFASEPKAEPETILQGLLTNQFVGKFETLHPTESRPKLRSRWFDTSEFPPPSAERIKYLSRDVLDPADIDGLASSKRAFLLEITALGNLTAANHLACELVGAFAEATHGFPWDDECRLIYTAASWRKRRIESWQGDVPDVRGEINMHSYRNPDLVRLVTLGMRKYGLADLVIDEVPSGESQNAGNAINACSQLLLEKRKPSGQQMLIRIEDIQHNGVRNHLDTECFDTAKRSIKVCFADAVADKGDPENRIWRIEFPDINGASPTETTVAALHLLFGTDNRIKFPKDKAALLAARDRARSAFFASVEQFKKGLAPNERLIVKAPFEIGADTEYMWLEVVGWKKDAVEGILQNDSPYDSSLRAGKRVAVPFERIYDYVHYLPDGTEEGNETTKVIEAEATKP